MEEYEGRKVGDARAVVDPTPYGDPDTVVVGADNPDGRFSARAGLDRDRRLVLWSLVEIGVRMDGKAELERRYVGLQPGDVQSPLRFVLSCGRRHPGRVREWGARVDPLPRGLARGHGNPCLRDGPGLSE